MECAQWLLTTALVSSLALGSASIAAAEVAATAGQDEVRIAAISGVHTPHQGFALSATVPSDRLCLELAQNLASELGIVVHVVCTDPTSGSTTIVAECGYARAGEATKVESYSRGWGHGGDPFLICVPPARDRFRAHRIAPKLDLLRPAPSPPG